MKTRTFNFRVSVATLAKFRSKCLNDYDRNPNEVLRELITAFSEGRVKITPTEQQLNERQIYHESGK